MNKLHILLVDDDVKISKLLAEFLEQQHFQVSQAENTQVAEQLIKETPPDLLLLDIMMPGEDGISFCRRLRQYFTQPIIMLTAVDSDIDEIVAHEVGADDYITKPYNMRVLLAKIKAVFRRSHHNLDITNPITEFTVEKALFYQFDTWHLNTANHELKTTDGVLIELSSAEYRLLLTFIEHPRRVLSREQLLDYTQGDDAIVFDRSIDVIISRLRQKIERDTKHPEIIKTMRNAGYMFTLKINKQYAEV